jgi:hypothetical protein
MLPAQTVPEEEFIVSFFVLPAKVDILVVLPRGGAVMTGFGVLTLFCSLQRLKVCLIASMAN